MIADISTTETKTAIARIVGAKMTKAFQDIITTTGRNARLFKGTSKGTAPKSYVRVGVVGHNIGNAYNSSTLTLYKNKSGVLKYEIYRDGNFYPYYGTFEYLD